MARKKSTPKEVTYNFDFRLRDGQLVDILHYDRVIDFDKFMQLLDCGITNRTKYLVAENDWCAEIKYRRMGNRHEVYVTTTADIWQRMEDAGALIIRDTVSERIENMRKMVSICNNVFNNCTFNF